MNSRTIALTVVGAVLAGVTGVHAQATSLVTLSSAAPSDISGAEDRNETETLEAPDNYILYQIEFGENLDVPCYIVAHYYSVTVRPARVMENNRIRGAESVQPVVETNTVTQSFERCDGSPGDIRRVFLGNNAGALPVGPLHTGVGAISVCQRQNNDRLKGITFTPATVGTNGVTHASNPNPPVNRNRCNDPQTTVACGSNRVATGVIISYGRAGGLIGKSVARRSITGLGLMCKRARGEALPR